MMFAAELLIMLSYKVSTSMYTWDACATSPGVVSLFKGWME